MGIIRQGVQRLSICIISQRVHACNVILFYDSIAASAVVSYPCLPVALPSQSKTMASKATVIVFCERSSWMQLCTGDELMDDNLRQDTPTMKELEKMPKSGLQTLMDRGQLFLRSKRGIIKKYEECSTEEMATMVQANWQQVMMKPKPKERETTPSEDKKFATMNRMQLATYLSVTYGVDTVLHAKTGKTSKVNDRTSREDIMSAIMKHENAEQDVQASASTSAAVAVAEPEVKEQQTPEVMEQQMPEKKDKKDKKSK